MIKRSFLYLLFFLFLLSSCQKSLLYRTVSPSEDIIWKFASETNRYKDSTKIENEIKLGDVVLSNQSIDNEIHIHENFPTVKTIKRQKIEKKKEILQKKLNKLIQKNRHPNHGHKNKSVADSFLFILIGVVVLIISGFIIDYSTLVLLSKLVHLLGLGLIIYGLWLLLEIYFN